MGVDRGSSSARDAARRRWALLARALLGDHRPGGDAVASVRRITRLGLINIISDSNSGTYKYSIADGNYWVNIRHAQDYLTPTRLSGFNNTGNVCVWPSEEVLAFLALSDLSLFSGKNVIELGGGMTCLAGLFVAKYSCASCVLLTDGNSTSVENVRLVLAENQFNSRTDVTCNRLRWGVDIFTNSVRSWDIILAADCLFFDDSRQDLVNTISYLLKNDGVAIVTAPNRKNTLKNFLNLVDSADLQYKIIENYHPRVWQQHLYLKQTCSEYDPDIHYPILIQITKKS